MSKMLLLISLVTFCGLISQATGYCMVIGRTYTTDKGEFFCEYLWHGLHMMFRNDSSFLTSDCHDCSCTANGLNCCSMYPSLHPLPAWCEWIAVRCQYRAVLKGLPTVACPYGDESPRPWNNTFTIPDEATPQ